MIEEIKFNDILFAIIIHNNFSKEGVTFFTPDDSSQQLAFMSHPKGKIIQPHLHNPVKREILDTKEVLLIKRGKLRVDFYDLNKFYLESRTLSEGDVILLCEGGHGFVVLEDLEMIEVKQGPYVGDLDKTKFVSNNDSDPNI
jgi:hypothetical protein